MQWFNWARVWSTQRMVSGKDAYKRAWLSEYAVNPDQNKITKSAKASMKFAVALMLEVSGNGLTVASTLEKRQLQVHYLLDIVAYLVQFRSIS